ncbi:metallopeptidase family protein [Aeromicrobium choanae]|nr:metallopeptidase family protein [Aeromicrobium choanae]
MASEPGPAPEVHGPRPGRSRDRRGRGPRGVMSLPGPLSPHGAPAHRNPREAFDDLVAGVLTRLDHHFAREPDHVEVVVEEAPLLPPGWDEPVPRSIVNTAPGGFRIVIYRLPVIGRARSAADLEEHVWTVLLTRLGEVWHHDPEDLDPRP